MGKIKTEPGTFKHEWKKVLKLMLCNILPMPVLMCLCNSLREGQAYTCECLFRGVFPHLEVIRYNIQYCGFHKSSRPKVNFQVKTSISDLSLL